MAYTNVGSAAWSYVTPHSIFKSSQVLPPYPIAQEHIPLVTGQSTKSGYALAWSVSEQHY